MMNEGRINNIRDNDVVMNVKVFDDLKKQLFTAQAKLDKAVKALEKIKKGELKILPCRPSQTIGLSIFELIQIAQEALSEINK